MPAECRINPLDVSVCMVAVDIWGFKIPKAYQGEVALAENIEMNDPGTR